MRTLVVDSISIEMEDRDAQIVERALKALNDQLAATTAASTKAADDARKAIEALTAELATTKKTVETKDAELATTKKQLEDSTLKPAQIDALVRDRGDIISKARAILGDKLVTDGKTDADIRRQVVDSKMGDGAKGWSDDQVKVGYDIFAKDVKVETGGSNNSNLNDVRNVLSNPDLKDGQAKTEKAYDEHNWNLTHAWMGANAPKYPG